MGIVRPATLDDIRAITPCLRHADRREIRAVTGAPPSLVLPECFRASRTAWALCPGDGLSVAGVMGVQDTFDPDIGVVWLVGRPVQPIEAFEFAMRSREFLPLVHSFHPILTNHVDERNTVHIRWLRWLGFSFLRRIERWGAESRPFLEFARLNPCALPSLPSA